MSENNINCYEFDDYRLDINNYQLFVGEETISLTQKSFELLHFLVENRGRILKKEELLDALWEGNFVEEANLTQHIYMLRKALKQKDRKKVYIETIPKNGYRFLAEVKEVYKDDIHTTLGGIHTTNPGSAKYSSENFQGGIHENAVSIQDKPIETVSPVSVEKRDNNFRQNFYSGKNLAVIGGLAGLLVLSYFAFNYFYGQQNNKINTGKSKSIAVLPFKQINGEKDEKLGIGVADVLIARLANIEEISVSPTTSILRFADSDNSDLFEVGQKLGVDYVIAGAIQKENNTVRVTTQLYSVKEKKQLWTETIDEEYSDIFTLQDKISEKVANKISMGLDINSSALPYRQYTKSIEAYQAYSMGLSYWNMHTVSGFENAIKQFNTAIEKDPHFVLAYAYLADSYAHSGHISHLMPSKKARQKGEEAAKNALELDPNCAEAMSALALIYAGEDKQAEAFKLMKRSIEIKPNDAHARHRISWMYANKGKINKAVKEMKTAQKLDPQSAYINLFYGQILYYSDKYDEAIASFKKALEIEPSSLEARWWTINSLEQKGDLDAAEKELEEILARYSNSRGLRLALSRIYAKNNKQEKSKKILNEIISQENIEPLNYLIALNQIALGEEDEAVKRLIKEIDSIEDDIYRIKYDSNLDSVRNNEEFAKALKAKEDAQGWS